MSLLVRPHARTRAWVRACMGIQTHVESHNADESDKRHEKDRNGYVDPLNTVDVEVVHVWRPRFTSSNSKQ